MDRPDSGRTNWEYELLRPPRDETKKEAANPQSEINALAADGWRLIDTIDYTGGGTKYIVFERPRSDGNNSHEDSS
jgi:hypothetical protein